MARPWKHPKTGIFWLRRGVPEDLRALVGKREEKLSLRTRDPADAKARHVVEMAKVEERWARLRSVAVEAVQSSALRTVTLSERQAHERAVWLYEVWLARYRENPSEQALWSTQLYNRLWKLGAALPDNGDSLEGFRDFRQLDTMRERCFDEADTLLLAHGWQVDEVSRKRLAAAMGAALQRASLALERLARGEAYDESQEMPWKPAGESGHLPKSEELNFKVLLAGWEAEKRPQAKTVYEWTREVNKFVEFLGHADAARVTAKDVVRWKEALIAEGRSAKTINDGKLVAVRTVLQWAVDNHRLSTNAAQSVRVDAKRPLKGRRSFTDEEAAIILGAARSENNAVLRWVPWLCAYSGARLSEICQLRAEDVCEIEKHWCIRIDSDAGSVKNASSERVVPLHQSIIEEGFLTFARGVKAGPLFSDLSPDKFGRRGGNGTKMLGRWVRGLGLDEKRLAPAHSWRHRMKTLARRHDLADDVVRALMGHSGRSVADSYGEFEVSTLYRELMKVPAIRI